MGPTPFSVGYVAECDDMEEAASVGFNGANAFQRWIRRVPLLQVAAAQGLQWGQRLSALDTSPPSAWRSPPSPLQWGQRLSALDTRTRSRNLWATVRFNGANAFQAEKEKERAEKEKGRRFASMGPTPFSVGYPGTTANCSRRSSSFNGANAFQRWIPSHPATPAPCRRRFNGANAFQRWIRT